MIHTAQFAYGGGLEMNPENVMILRKIFRLATKHRGFPEP
jgi:hypothetical protein